MAGPSSERAALQHCLDAEEVLEVLKGLIRRASSPVVQQCLKGARFEIAHLSTEADIDEDSQDLDDRPEDDQGQREVA